VGFTVLPRHSSRAAPVSGPPFPTEAPPLEDPLHRAILNAVRAALPLTFLVIHVPNGVRCSAAEWRRMLSLGAMAGWPDLTIVGEGRCWVLEVKTPDGFENAAQLEASVLIGAAGVPRAVVRSVYEALVTLHGWGLPLHWDYRFQPQPRPVVLPRHMEPARRAWSEAMLGAAGAWRALQAEKPPAPWSLRELLSLESELRGAVL
jgi:hypothetical protein